jgi:nickel/cobalt transporter (NicO) family protein
MVRVPQVVQERMVQPRSNRIFRWVGASTLLALVLAVFAALLPPPAGAHPMGNFTVNRYSRIAFSEEGVRVDYVLDFAEIPTLLEMPRIDTNGDEILSPAELEVYVTALMPELLRDIRLVVGNHVLPLEIERAVAITIPGLADMPTLRIDAVFTSQLPEGWQEHPSGGYIDRNYQDRLGWRELVIVGGPGVEVTSTTALTEDITNGLRAYPDSSARTVLLMAEATFSLAPGAGAAAIETTAAQSAERVQEGVGEGRATSGVAALITARTLSPSVIAISILLALFWGAVHALSPGHGKAVVAAYLVGARGTAQHAMFLGLTVTLTHTAGVFALGGVTLYLSRYILPEDLYPWLSVASGLLVIGIGATLAWTRLRTGRGHQHANHGHSDLNVPLTHSHGGRTHTHLPPGAHGTPVTWKALLALGVSGGLIPCPSALVLLLAAISLGRLELGMLLVTAFSLGLAGVLTAIGLLLVYARRFFERFSFTPRVPRLLPVASAAAISFAGVVIVVESLRQSGIV